MTYPFKLIENDPDYEIEQLHKTNVVVNLYEKIVERMKKVISKRKQGNK